ncbi:MAG TPA: hypothetical protein VM509_06605, partial [Planctomycetota bacterium]|nr:hypothetical protein [Planctomycetota bacterium]
MACRFGFSSAAAALLGTLASAQTTTLVSAARTGGAGDARSIKPAISSDGKRVAFQSLADDLVSGDSNGVADIFLRDLSNGTLARCSVSSAGAQSDFQSIAPALSGDGQIVAFQSFASNLVAGDANLTWDVFVRELQAGITRRVSVAWNGAEADGPSDGAALSADG